MLQSGSEGLMAAEGEKEIEGLAAILERIVHNGWSIGFNLSQGIS